MNSGSITPWSSVGYLVAKRTYARRINEDDPNSPTEEWVDICNRVVQACRDQLHVGFTRSGQVPVATRHSHRGSSRLTVVAELRHVCC